MPLPNNCAERNALINTRTGDITPRACPESNAFCCGGIVTFACKYFSGIVSRDHATATADWQDVTIACSRRINASPVTDYERLCRVLRVPKEYADANIVTVEIINKSLGRTIATITGKETRCDSVLLDPAVAWRVDGILHQPRGHVKIYVTPCNSILRDADVDEP